MLIHPYSCPSSKGHYSPGSLPFLSSTRLSLAMVRHSSRLRVGKRIVLTPPHPLPYYYDRVQFGLTGFHSRYLPDPNWFLFHPLLRHFISGSCYTSQLPEKYTVTSSDQSLRAATRSLSQLATWPCGYKPRHPLGGEYLSYELTFLTFDTFDFQTSKFTLLSSTVISSTQLTPVKQGENNISKWINNTRIPRRVLQRASLRINSRS